MKIKSLLSFWNEHAGQRHTAQEYRVKLPVHDAARIEALREMFPGRNTTDIITDLIATALDELEESLPYVKGSHVAAEDEFGDPIYEDIGPSPQFQTLAKKHVKMLETELKGKGVTPPH